MTKRGASRFLDVGPLARLYAKSRLAQMGRLDAGESQEETLLNLVAKAKATKFGAAHAFWDIRSSRDYQARVGLRHYEDFWRDWWEADYPSLVDVTWPGKIPFFAETSGTTTGESKHIPYTPAMRRAAAKGFLDLLCFHFARKPDSKVLGGAVLALTGPKILERKTDHTMSGAVSAITIGAIPGFLERRVLPPAEISNIENWNEKIEKLARIAPSEDVRFLGGSPNWMLIFFEELARQHGGDTLADWFPNLELVVHGGINFSPYRDRFAALLAGTHAETREMYSASEGVFAVADRGDGEGLRLILDGTVFFEFVPVSELGASSPRRFTAAQVARGQDYAVAISTAAGLWSYLVGDVVRFVDLDPPRVVVVGRVGNALSEFGEHLIESEIAEAISHAAKALGLHIQDYCVGAVHKDVGGHHRYLIETKGGTGTGIPDRFAELVDQSLASRNADYRELRRDDAAVSAPEVILLKSGAFQEWMRVRRKLGGQNKLPHIVKDRALFSDIDAFVRRSDMAGEEA
jgi:hypothetical protein